MKEEKKILVVDDLGEGLIARSDTEIILNQIFIYYEKMPRYQPPPPAPRNNHKAKRYFSD